MTGSLRGAGDGGACVGRGQAPGSTVDSGGAIAVSARRRGQRGGPVGRRGSSALSARPASGPAQTHLVEGQPRAVSPLVIRGARLDKHVTDGSTLPGTTSRDPVQTVPAGQNRAAGGCSEVESPTSRVHGTVMGRDTPYELCRERVKRFSGRPVAQASGLVDRLSRR